MRLIIGKLFIITLVVLTVFSCDSGDIAGEAAAPPPGGSGQAGSMARFAIKEDLLYVLGTSTLHVYNIEADTFKLLRNVDISVNEFGAAMETIFVNGDFLYLGATDGMYIYSIANPQNPRFAFQYQHIVACDPVVVQGNRAYVTMRSGNACGGGVNALDILDITNPYEPELLRSHTMTSPHGLGVNGNLLFVCEGNAGLKVFDVSDELGGIIQLQHEQGLHAYDVIVRQNHAIVTGDDGIYQYEYSTDGQQLDLESVIPVNLTL